jgi:hypothetical protein
MFELPIDTSRDYCCGLAILLFIMLPGLFFSKLDELCILLIRPEVDLVFGDIGFSFILFSCSMIILSSAPAYSSFFLINFPFFFTDELFVILPVLYISPSD